MRNGLAICPGEPASEPVEIGETERGFTNAPGLRRNAKWSGHLSLLQLPNLNHRSEVTPGVMENETRFLLVDFFGRRRKENDARRQSPDDGAG
jgi:hypothetical protein